VTEKIRTIPSGNVGLDLALGGGFRFLRRTHDERLESATVLIRGGPGTGKSVLAEDVALRLAAKLGGDVLYVCVEVLPSEILAQRMGFDGFDSKYVVDLSQPGVAATERVRPYLVLGMHDVPSNDAGVPDIGQAMLDLARIAADRGFKPAVLVIDSLSDGYGLGGTAPRPVVDGICKLAIEQGWGLVLVEEVADGRVSPWTFAVDTVLTLRMSTADGEPQTQREMLVTKHRFGACEPGPHRLQIESERVRVIPPLAAYRKAEEVLALPVPAKRRSMRVPVYGAEPDWAGFDLPDEQGALVRVEGGVDAVEAGRIASAIGQRSVDGQAALGDFVHLFLAEKSDGRPSAHPRGVTVGTLDQFADGADWLEFALHLLARREHDVARVMIGPTQRLGVYEHRDDLRRGMSLLLNLLQQRGFLVVLYGKETMDVIRAGIVHQTWQVTEDSSSPPDGGKFLITASTVPPTVFRPKT
jgi:KaiC/GvpD/RAD55 family RecA-like ATPase